MKTLDEIILEKERGILNGPFKFYYNPAHRGDKFYQIALFEYYKQFGEEDEN